MLVEKRRAGSDMKGLSFLVFLVVLTAVDLLIPYLWLRDVPRFAASFLFWCVLTVGMIVWAVFATRRWGEKE